MLAQAPVKESTTKCGVINYCRYQLATVQNDPLPAEFAEKTITYAQVKTAYFMALREAMPELTNIGTGKEPRPGQVGKFTKAFELETYREQNLDLVELGRLIR